MENIIRGKVFVLGDNIDTDQIIPAEYLSYDPSDPDERKFFGRYALSGVPPAQSGLPHGSTPFVAEGELKTEYAVIVGGRNFGCGSSREHAPLAISEAGCHAVVAESFARIFYRNSINGGYLAPLELTRRFIDDIVTGDEVEIDIDAHTLTNLASGAACELRPLGEAAAIIEAGGIFEHAKRAGMID